MHDKRGTTAPDLSPAPQGLHDILERGKGDVTL